MPTLHHTTARTARRTTHIQTNISDGTPTEQHTTKTKTCTRRSMEEGGETALCVASDFSKLVLLTTNPRVQLVYSIFRRNYGRHKNIRVVIGRSKKKVHNNIFPIQMGMWPGWRRRKRTSWRAVKPPIGWRSVKKNFENRELAVIMKTQPYTKT